MTLKLWRLLALMAIAACAATSAAVVWVALAYGSNLRKIEQGAQVCLSGERPFDSIAAAQMIGRLDLVSFLLTVGGILLAVFALMGFWMIRREALDEAGRVASDEARRILQVYSQGLDGNENGTHIDVQKAGTSPMPSATKRERARRKKRDAQTPSFDPTGVSTAGAEEEKPGASDARPKAGAGRDPGAPDEDSR